MLLCSILAMFTAVYKLLSVPSLPPRCLNESKKVHKGSMEVENVSKFLKGIKVWHKVGEIVSVRKEHTKKSQK